MYIYAYAYMHLLINVQIHKYHIYSFYTEKEPLMDILQVVNGSSIWQKEGEEKKVQRIKGACWLITLIMDVYHTYNKNKNKIWNQSITIK